VESATWSQGGQLDWWVKEPQERRVGYAVLMAGNGESEPLTFVPGAAHSIQAIPDDRHNR
jgi:hypothetical protein